MKTTKGGKVMNPTDAYRKELRKKELKRNKKERKKVREVGILKKDPDTLKEQIEKLEMMKADGALDKARKHKKRQLEDTLNLVLKKRKEYQEKMHEKGETPVMFSHLGPPKRRTAAEEDERVKHPKPEDSVYYHPTLNPTGAPPPGKLPMYKSSIGPRIPLGASSSNDASSSLAELEEVGLVALLPPPPPPPPPLPASTELSSAENSDAPKSLSLPLPPVPSKPVLESSGSLPPPPPPPPPPPSKEPSWTQSSLPPPPPQGASQTERGNKQNVASEGHNPTESDRATTRILPPPPPPPGLPPMQSDQQYDVAISSAGNNVGTSDISKIPLPPPPPPRHPPPGLPRFPLVPSLQPDVLPPGISRVPPPPPPPPPSHDMRPALPVPGLPMQPLPGMHALPMTMPPFAMLPGLPPMGALSTMMRPLLPGFPQQEDENAMVARAFIPQKPSYVKSAASTVVKRPLAQHTPELTAMIPASVRVRRETAAPKARHKAQNSVSTTTSISRPTYPAAAGRSEEQRNTSTVPKTQSIDDSYTAFLEDMKALGALDS